MILIYTGDGKGKTSAAVGQCIRALGQGLRVAFGQFMKKTGVGGEQIILAQLLNDRFGAFGAGFYRSQDEFPAHREKAVQLLCQAQVWLNQGLDMLILDEALYVLHEALITCEEMELLLKQCTTQNCHLVLTGRHLPGWLHSKADLISEIIAVKHPYERGEKAAPGIDF